VPINEDRALTSRLFVRLMMTTTEWIILVFCCSSIELSLTTRRRERKRIAKRFLLLSIFIKPLVFSSSSSSLAEVFFSFPLSPVSTIDTRLQETNKQTNNSARAREREKENLFVGEEVSQAQPARARETID
jgi:hypothetical protein